MSGKRLWPLAAIFVILMVLTVVLKRQTVPTSIVQEAGFVRLVPPTVRAATIRGIDLYHGAHPKAMVRLRKRDDTWVVSSHFDAPGNVQAIQKLLDQLGSLTGELRAEREELLGEFRLRDDQALHLKVYTDPAETPAAYLLAGRGRGRSSFMRRHGETNVYRVDLNLYTMAGRHGDKADQPFTATSWVDLRLVNVPEEDVRGIELRTPTQQVRLLRSSAAARRWTLALPEGNYAVKQDGVQGLVSALRTLRGEALVDPGIVTDTGLEAPSSRVILITPTHQITVHLGNEAPGKAGTRYAHLRPDGPVYLLPQRAWQRLFPKLGTILELPLLQVAPQDVTQVALQRQGETWNLRRLISEETGADDAVAPWHIAEAPEAVVTEAHVTALTTAISQLTADDLLTHPGPSVALDHPNLALTVTYGSNQQAYLALYPVPGEDGERYYARRQDTTHLFVLPRAVYQKLAEAFTQLPL